MISRFIAFCLILMPICGSIIQCSHDNPVAGNDVPNAGFSWYQQNPLPTSNSLLDIEFVGDREAWAVSDAATILHTLDGGQTWSEKHVFPAAANSLFFINAQKGWAAGEYGMIMHTCDGGRSWSKQPSGTKTKLTAITFVDNLRGWAAGYSGVILSTDDGGGTWHHQQDNNQSFLRDILFIDEDRGWAVGRTSATPTGAELLYTENGGQDWTPIDAGIPVDLGEPYQYVTADLWSIASASDKVISIVGEAIQWDLIGGIRLRTTDGGDSWEVELTDVPHYDVQYVSEESGFIAGYGGLIFSTNDGGQTWDRKFMGGWRLYSIAFSNLQNGCAVGSAGTILISSDGGDNWEQITSGSRRPLMDIQFIDVDRGWAVGFGGVLRTVDGGLTWEQTGGTAGQALCFLDYQTGWACDYSGNLDKTNDGGITWTRVHETIEARVYDFVFVDSLIGWVVGMPSILMTSDGGQTWTVQWSGSGLHLNGITFVDSLCGWVVGDNGTILHTDNGGSLWQIQETPIITPLESVFFIDSFQGWAVGGSSILVTSDGGVNWKLQTNTDLPGVPGMRSITFSGAYTGWIVGRDGFILSTTDGGKSWIRQYTHTSADLFCVFALDPETVWAAGWVGTILHTTNGGW